MNLIDCHTHTQFSVDSDADIIQMIEKAISLGLSAYAVTDHCECNRWYSEEYYKGEEGYKFYNFGQDFEKSVSAVTSLKKKYPDFNLLCGVELGQATQDIEIAEKVVSDNRLDFVIGSVHQLPKTDDFCFLDYQKYSSAEIKNLLERYFLEINKICNWGKFDVLGHLTYNLRYMHSALGYDPDISPYDDIIADSFKKLIQHGKGIEINTSGLRQSYGQTFPNLKYIKLFRQLGGEIISVGSDSHTVEDLGSGIKEGIKLASDAGFKYICYFKQHSPVFIEINQKGFFEL